METGDGLDDEHEYREPLPPDDRIWRHPSEIGAALRRTSSTSPRAPWLVGGVAGLTGALVASGLIAAAGGFRERITVTRKTVVEHRVDYRPDASTTGAGSVNDIARRVGPAIVQVKVARTGSSTSGSGVIFRDDGNILTNAHLVGGAEVIAVVVESGRSYRATLTGLDPETDVAVLKIDGGPFPVAGLGTATRLEVGQPAIAIGSPLGLSGGPSVTVGVVSALGRRVDAGTGPPLLDMIQTDAPLSPGSSGGALVDASGAVIGITTAVGRGDEGVGLGFATPIDIARSVASDLVERGKVVHSWIGIEGSEIGTDIATELGIAGGVVVKRVSEPSPARRAGLEVSDVIVGMQWPRRAPSDVFSITGLVVSLRRHKPGEIVMLHVLRDGNPVARKLRVTLVERPRNP